MTVGIQDFRWIGTLVRSGEFWAWMAAVVGVVGATFVVVTISDISTFQAAMSSLLWGFSLGLFHSMLFRRDRGNRGEETR